MSNPVQPEQILVVEDSADFQLMIKTALGPAYTLTPARSLAEARTRMSEASFTLLILDVNLPDGNGFDFCRELREQEKTQLLRVIFLTGRTDLGDKLKGFSHGADDYIVKPFEALELRARIEAKLSRAREKLKTSPAKQVFEAGALHLDLATQRVFVVEKSGAQTELALTPIEFKILYHLARNGGSVVSRSQLLETVWGKQTHVFDRATDKHVSSLRQKLGPTAKYIETVSRVGYRFNLKSGA